MCFDKMYVRYNKMCIVCNKVNFITNIINSTRIHTFYFYNNKDTFINTDTIFITKHTNFIKINTSPVAGPKCSPCFISLIQASYFKKKKKLSTTQIKSLIHPLNISS
jgi:hypothetical protein